MDKLHIAHHQKWEYLEDSLDTSYWPNHKFDLQDSSSTALNLDRSIWDGSIQYSQIQSKIYFKGISIVHFYHYSIFQTYIHHIIVF